MIHVSYGGDHSLNLAIDFRLTDRVNWYYKNLNYKLIENLPDNYSIIFTYHKFYNEHLLCKLKTGWS